MFNRMLLPVLAVCLLFPAICHADSYATYFHDRPREESYGNVKVLRTFDDNTPAMSIYIAPQNGKKQNTDFALYISYDGELMIITLEAASEIPLNGDYTLQFRFDEGKKNSCQTKVLRDSNYIFLPIGRSQTDIISTITKLLTTIKFTVSIDGTNIRCSYYMGTALRYIYELGDVFIDHAENSK